MVGVTIWMQHPDALSGRHLSVQISDVWEANMMTTSETVMRQKPERVATAPTIANILGLHRAKVKVATLGNKRRLESPWLIFFKQS